MWIIAFWRRHLVDVSSVFFPFLISSSMRNPVRFLWQAFYFLTPSFRQIFTQMCVLNKNLKNRRRCTTYIKIRQTTNVLSKQRYNLNFFCFFSNEKSICFVINSNRTRKKKKKPTICTSREPLRNATSLPRGAFKFFNYFRFSRESYSANIVYCFRISNGSEEPIIIWKKKKKSIRANCCNK